MGLNPLAGLLRGNSKNGRGALSERDVRALIYGSQSNGHHTTAKAVRAAPNGNGRPRDERGRFLPTGNGAG
jgi:hypothetical protein